VCASRCHARRQPSREITLFEKRVRYRLPRPAIRAGVVYVTEDRKLEGFFEHISIADNIYTNYLGAGLQAHGVVSLKETKVSRSTGPKRSR
jgi:simple sugar transport system ATP-binding protein